MIEKTLILMKPDAVKRSLVGRILQRFEDVGLKIIASKMVWANEELAKKHYFDVAERHGDKVFKINTDYLTSGPVIAFCLEGVNAIAIVRKLVGKTNPLESPVGTIRGDLCHVSMDYVNSKERFLPNLVHSSANPDEAKREIALWFDEEELHSYSVVHEVITQ